MTLIGATAIEDKLQDGVPDTIANLADVWIDCLHKLFSSLSFCFRLYVEYNIVPICLLLHLSLLLR